jgi:hypothetical protein
MLQQEQLIGDLVAPAGSNELVLLLPRLTIGDAAQPMNLERRHALHDSSVFVLRGYFGPFGPMPAENAY